GGEGLAADGEARERSRTPAVLDLFARAVEERAGRTDGRTHRAQPGRRPIVAEVALHHEGAVRMQLGHTERTGEDTVAAPDAAVGLCAQDDALRVDLDRVRRTDARACWLAAVHADRRGGLHGCRALEVVEVDHAEPAVARALTARRLASPTADAAVGVDEELADPRRRHWTHRGPSRSMRTAATLNSGMPAIGSYARSVRRLADWSPGQWYGMKTVSGR